MIVQSIVLFVHIAGMLILFGGLGLEWLTLRTLGRIATQEQASPWLNVCEGLPRAMGISVGLILLSGIYLAVRAGAYDSRWILVSFGAMVLMGILGGPVIRSRMNTIRQAGAAGGTAVALRRHASDPLVRASLFIRVAVGLAIVYLMIAKPGLGESLLLTGVAVALGAAMSVGQRRAQST